MGRGGICLGENALDAFTILLFCGCLRRFVGGLVDRQGINPLTQGLDKILKTVYSRAGCERLHADQTPFAATPTTTIPDA